MLPKLPPNHFQPLSCTGEMLEAKLRQQVQAHMLSGLGVRGSMNHLVDNVDLLQA